MGDPQIKEVSLVRSMGFWQIWAIGVGAVVGDGIFLYMGEGVSAAGPSALLAWVNFPLECRKPALCQYG